MKGFVSKVGALPDTIIKEMKNAGFIKYTDDKNIRPASLDLSISDEVYKVKGVFQPRFGETIRELLDQFSIEKHSLNACLERDQVYLARIKERITLPRGVYGYCNPKSTSGRLDMHVRVMADGVPRYDAITKSNFEGELWLLIHPRSFSVKLSAGQTLSQIRFFSGDTRLNDLELQFAMKQYELLHKKNVPVAYEDILIHEQDGALVLTLGFSEGVFGYELIRSNDTIDLAKVAHYDARNFFRPLEYRNGYLELKSGSFYILTSLESVRVPPELACEMVPMDERSGDFRSHYAGFIDPGWGWGKNGEGKGRPLTLEVRPFEDIVARVGQPIAKIRFERLVQTPDSIYDAMDSSYLSQSGPKLAKQFKAYI